MASTAIAGTESSSEPSRTTGVGRGELAVKEEFLIPIIHPSTVVDNVSILADDSSTTDAAEHDSKRHKKSKQGRNNRRAGGHMAGEGKGNGRKGDGGIKLCHGVISGSNKTCDMGDRCKYSHDVDAYMATKLPDLQCVCPLAGNVGGCKFGFTCRMYGSHSAIEAGSSPLDPSMNHTGPWLHELRKNRMSFPRSDEFLSSLPTGGMSADRYKKVQEKALKCGKVVADVVQTTEEVKETVNEELRAQALAKCEESSADNPVIRIRKSEKKTIDFREKVYIAPLTTVGNLPFRATLKQLGADITCGEMAVATSLMQGTAQEWSLVRRHPSEDVFGVQLAGGYPDTMTKATEVLVANCNVDFIDINCGCPLDLICNKGAGSGLLERPRKLEQIVRGLSSFDVPIIPKLRMGIKTREDKRVAHKLIPMLFDWGASAVSLHGRYKEQRYSSVADWNYIGSCASSAAEANHPLIGGGDVMSHEEFYGNIEQFGVETCMIGRGALIKPWLCTEIKERRLWDISANERFDILRNFCSTGLGHWGSDERGVVTTRRFLLEWLSFLHRYVPVGLLERPPQRIGDRPPRYVGRNDLETLMASPNVGDWVRISEMLLGPAPQEFIFIPKHKANSFAPVANVNMAEITASTLVSGLKRSSDEMTAGLVL